MTTNDSPKNELRNHSFDGIQEYDNDLPRWWVRLFWITIFFAIPYLIWYHSSLFPAKSLVDEYMADTKEANSAENATAASDAIDYTQPELIAKGKATFDANCVACHGANAQGVIGPNLTDDFWLHGDTIADVEKTISEGVPPKGMPSWGNMLGKEKIIQLVAFIKSIQGTKVENPKDPQGNPGKLQ